ncbi:hypothetical protein ACX9NE_28870, partial [Mycobacterium sp. ML4]
PPASLRITARGGYFQLATSGYFNLAIDNVVGILLAEASVMRPDCSDTALIQFVASVRKRSTTTPSEGASA